jgi:hypothetical protein
VDDPYEPPLNAELVIKNQEMTVQESVDIILKALQKEGVLVGGPTLKNGLPYPDGDEMIELNIPPSKVKERLEEAQKLPKALLTDIDVNWLQVSLLLSAHLSSPISRPSLKVGLHLSKVSCVKAFSYKQCISTLCS